MEAHEMKRLAVGAIVDVEWDDGEWYRCEVIRKASRPLYPSKDAEPLFVTFHEVGGGSPFRLRVREREDVCWPDRVGVDY